MRIIGIDIGGAYSTAFLLEERPENPKAFINSKEFVTFKVEYTRESLQALIDLDADWYIFEPTGYHYEALIITWLDKAGKNWKKVVGTRMAGYRNSLGIAKTDGRDAYAIALYGEEFINQNAFIPKCELREMRRTWIERHNLMEMRGQVVQKIRQKLLHEFPEVANKELDRKWGDPSPAIIRWIAGDETLTPVYASRYRNLYQSGRHKTPSNGKITETLGTIGNGLNDYTRLLARQIFEADSAAQRMELQMQAALEEERFTKYREAFNQVGFSTSVQVIWLSRIYPVERYFGDDGRPIVTRRLSKTGKTVTHHASLSRFKASLGAGTTPHTSGIRGETKTRYLARRKKGDHEKQPMGDSYCRKAFTLWAMKVLEMKRLAPDTEAKQKMIDKHAQLKEKGTKMFQRLGTMQGYTARILFRLLS